MTKPILALARVVLGGMLLFSIGVTVPDALAALPEDVKEVTDATNLPLTNLVDALFIVLRVLLSFAAVIAVAAIIFGGFYYITSAGDEGRAETGKKIILYAIIGLIIIGAAGLIVNIIINTFVKK